MTVSWLTLHCLPTQKQAHQQLQADQGASLQPLEEALALLQKQSESLDDMKAENSRLREALGQTHQSLAGLTAKLELVVQPEQSPPGADMWCCSRLHACSHTGAALGAQAPLHRAKLRLGGHH